MATEQTPCDAFETYIVTHFGARIFEGAREGRYFEGITDDQEWAALTSPSVRAESAWLAAEGWAAKQNKALLKNSEARR